MRSSPTLTRASTAVAGVLTGISAGYLMAQPMTSNFAYVYSPHRFESLAYSTPAGLAFALVTSIVACAYLLGAESRVQTVAVAIAAAAMFGAASLRSAGAGSLYLNGLGSGMLMGAGISALWRRHYGAPCILGGLYLMYVYGDEINRASRIPRRYADYLPSPAQSALPFILGLAAAIAIGISLALGGRLRASRVAAVAADRGASIFGQPLRMAVGLSLLELALVGWLQRSSWHPAVWVIAVVFTFAAVALCAWMIPGRDGSSLLSSLAVVATWLSVLGWHDYGWEVLGAATVLTVLGLAAGRRWRAPIPAAGVLIVVSIVAFVGLREDLTDTVMVVAVCATGVAAFLLGSTLPHSVSHAPLGLVLIFALPVFGGATTISTNFGWTAYSPLTQRPDLPDIHTLTVAIVSVIIELCCAVVISMLWKQRAPSPPVRHR